MKGKFTSVILAVVLVAITAGTIFFGYSKASGKITKSGAEEELKHAVNDIVNSLPRYLSAADGTVRNAYACIEQAQIIIYFRHRSDGRTRVL